MSTNRFTTQAFGEEEIYKKHWEERMDERYEQGLHYLMPKKHRGGCFMCEHSSGLDPEAFILYDGIEYRDRIGRKRKSGGQMWYRFACNDAECRAVLLVRWDEFARLLTKGFANA